MAMRCWRLWLAIAVWLWLATGGAGRQRRVAQAARIIIEASPAPHSAGGRPPGADRAVAAAQGRRAQPTAIPAAVVETAAVAEPAAAGL